MPEAAVYEDCYLASREGEVRSAWQGGVMQAKSEANRVHVATHVSLRLGVAACDGPHHP